MSPFVNWNGTIVKEDYIIISPNNRSFRYGDGCFETMKIINEELLLKDLHFQRLFSSLKILQFSIPPSLTSAYLLNQISKVIHANGHQSFARVRLVMYRGDGGLQDLDNNGPNFIIQSWPGNDATNSFNQKGLVINFYPAAKKTFDLFSSLKSNNYLAYAMGALWAKKNGLDDCILFNAFNRIADATIANIFIVSNGTIKTPALSEGCVDGVMRKYLINCFNNDKALTFEQTEITPEELLNASEVFLTNAIYGIRWVQSAGENTYANTLSSLMYQKFIAPLFSSATF